MQNTISNKWTEITEPIELTVELIVFDLGEVSFGIPMTRIDRIINHTQLGEKLNIDKNIEILDLHHRLFGTSISNPTAMVICRGDKLYGIAIDTTPTLTIVPLDRIRIIPDEFRQNNRLGIASHIAIISATNSELTIFILGS